jgi:hypothetical protein
VALGAVRPGAGVVRIASDPAVDEGAQHASMVEPHAAANGRNVVAVFQSGRFFDGGAAAVGFALSGDAGRTWRSGVLPSLTAASSPPGPYARASDPVVAWDARHGRWLAATLALGDETTAVAISTSSDGAGWSAPVAAVTSPRIAQEGDETALDKEWLACDDGSASPFFGRCYLAYTDFRRGGVALQSSDDGGITWSAPLTVSRGVDIPGPQLAIRPSGELVMVFLGIDVESIASTDGGVTFSHEQRIAALRVMSRLVKEESLRVFPLPTAGADGAGTVYAVWFDCRFRRRCNADDAVLSRSAPDAAWTAPRRIPLVPRASKTDVVLPSLGVDPAARGRLVLTYYTLTPAGCLPRTCRLNAWQAFSRTAGSRWSTPRRLNATPMRLGWLPWTETGRMVGDYAGSVYTSGRAVSVVSIARAPRNGRLDDAVYGLSAAAG